MKTFLDSIKARADQAKATIAKADTLALLEQRHQEARAEYDRQGSSPNTKRSEAHAALTTASQAAQLARQVLADAEAVLRECRPFLNAHADVVTAHSAYAEARQLEHAARAEIANLQKLIPELNGEISELSAKAKRALAAHGQTSIAARLTGQQAPPTPKLLITLSTDLESRKATLESAESMVASAEARRDLARDNAKQSRHEWQFARGKVATIEYHDALAMMAPQISMYLAATAGHYKKIEFAPGLEAIEAASALLDAELGAGLEAIEAASALLDAELDAELEAIDAASAELELEQSS